MKTIFLCAGALMGFVLVACTQNRAAIVVGGLYASKSEDGSFRVSKVLAVDASAVHVRIYKNKFPNLPQNLDPSVLSLGQVGDREGFGIGHAPIAKDGWLASQVFLKKEPLRDDELEGYKYYIEATRKK